MNGQSDNATVPSRTTVRIPTASGDELEAWLYLPEGEGPHPAVVMAHGIGAIKAGRDHGELAGYVDRRAADVAADRGVIDDSSTIGSKHGRDFVLHREQHPANVDVADWIVVLDRLLSW